ncbi:adhesion G-protein coupled receptor D1-like [Ciona intestinalis]
MEKKVKEKLLNKQNEETGDVELAVARGRCGDTPWLNMTRYRAVSNLEQNCSDVIVTSSQFYIKGDVMRSLTEHKPRNSWSGHRSLEMPTSSIPYLSITAYDATNGSQLNTSVTFVASLPAFDLLETEIEQLIEGNVTKDTIYVTNTEYKCSFIDVTKASFSDIGCVRTMSNISGTVTCSCNHTTVFAILLSVKIIAVPYAVKICSYVTQSFSVIMLIVTFITLMHYRNLINSDRTIVQINISISLLLLHVTSLFHDVMLPNEVTCVVQAIATHFFLLTTASWMMTEGLRLHTKTSSNVIAYGNFDADNRNAIYLFIGWVAPAIIVGTSAGVGFSTSGTYMNPCYLYKEATKNGTNTTIRKYDICWLNPTTSLYLGTVIGPVAFCLGVNVIVALKVMLTLGKLKAQSQQLQPQKSREAAQTSIKYISSAIKALVTLLPVLGISWVLGFFTGVENLTASIVMMYINCVVNGLQGVLVFVLYCYRNNALRTVLENIRLRKIKKTNDINEMMSVPTNVTTTSQ